MALTLSQGHSRRLYGHTFSHRDGSSPEANSLPDGFPSSLPTRLVWNGASLAERCYTYYLAKDNISEIEAGLAAFKGLRLLYETMKLKS